VAFLSSGIRVVGVAGFIPHMLGARWRLDLEELPDLDAPELVHVAHADAVRVCRVAELVRVNLDAKQIREEETKTHCLLVATNNRRNKQKSPQWCKF
jgi:hypothetical protein